MLLLLRTSAGPLSLRCSSNCTCSAALTSNHSLSPTPHPYKPPPLLLFSPTPSSSLPLLRSRRTCSPKVAPPCLPRPMTRKKTVPSCCSLFGPLDAKAPLPPAPHQLLLPAPLLLPLPLLLVGSIPASYSSSSSSTSPSLRLRGTMTRL